MDYAVSRYNVWGGIVLCLFAMGSAGSAMGSTAEQTTKTTSADSDKKAQTAQAASSAVPAELLSLDHPLVDRIWQPAANMYIDKQSLLQKLLQSEFILLGETHDNRLHHDYQIWVVEQLTAYLKKHPAKRSKSKSKDSAAVVMFEMITDKQARDLGKNRKSTRQLLAVLNKEKTGWNYDVYYRQLFDAVIKSGLDIYPASLDRDDLMQIVMHGEENIPKPIKDGMDANIFTEEQKQSLKREIIESHCNMASDGMVAGMTMAQRVKDTVMSNSLMDTAPHSVKVLIAGSGHVRVDRGVPMYIKRRHPDAKLISLAFMEVMEGEHNIDFYRKAWGEAELPFDYVWFTPRVQREDPCEAYAKHLKRHGQNAKQTAKQTGEESGNNDDDKANHEQDNKKDLIQNQSEGQ